jgi:hypothetical protein
MHRLGPRMVFSSSFGAPVHVTTSDITVQAQEGMRLVYTVPPPCVFRMAPSPLIHMAWDPVTGGISARLHDGLPFSVFGTLGSQTAKATRVVVRANGWSYA